jgi:hypothetical protein
MNKPIAITMNIEIIVEMKVVTAVAAAAKSTMKADIIEMTALAVIDFGRFMCERIP